MSKKGLNFQPNLVVVLRSVLTDCVKRSIQNSLTVRILRVHILGQPTAYYAAKYAGLNEP